MELLKDMVEFDRVYSLMERSFPAEEIRDCEGQRALLKDPAYGIWLCRDQETGEILGFAAVWELEGWRFLEHLAVDPACRNRGIGTAVLGHVIGLDNKPLCLEVELPEDPMTARRVGFYERNGLFLNPFPYLQPALGAGKGPVPLGIMTYGAAVSREEFTHIRHLLYTGVYKEKP